MDILPIKYLTDSDSLIFGPLNVALATLARSGLPVAKGLVVCAPKLLLSTTLEHFDFGTKETFEQTLTIVKKELQNQVIPDEFKEELGKNSKFFLNGQTYDSQKELWLALLLTWIEEIKGRLWTDGFYKGITENLTPQKIFFIKKVTSLGSAYLADPEDLIVEGNMEPKISYELEKLIKEADKRLKFHFKYLWIIDNGLQIIGLEEVTDKTLQVADDLLQNSADSNKNEKAKSVVKVFYSPQDFVVEANADGIYLVGEDIEAEELTFRLAETASSFPDIPVLLKLPDLSEGMGKVRGSLRLLHEKNLFTNVCQALDFARHKQGLKNVGIVIPFTRGVADLMQIKRELAVKKLMRKSSLQMWLEICVPENIISIEEYLITGLDGVVLNLDELLAHLAGFDPKEEELAFYKTEVKALLTFLEDGLKLLHKSKIPFLAFGNLTLNSVVLDFLVEKGVYGVIVGKSESHSTHDLLSQAEKRMIMRKSA